MFIRSLKRTHFHQNINRLDWTFMIKEETTKLKQVKIIGMHLTK